MSEKKIGYFHMKSVLLGIGIGVIVTSLISMIFFAGRDPMEDLSKEQIIKEAEKYGMVRSPIVLPDDD